MTFSSNFSAEEIAGSWRTPETDGDDIVYCFYPDGEFLSQNSRHGQTIARGSWTLEAGDLLVISDLVYLHAFHSEAIRDLILAERHAMRILEMSPEMMLCEQEESLARVVFLRAGKLPDREAHLHWRHLLPRLFSFAH